MKELIKKCPKCGECLIITEYSCPSCNTKIQGEFNITESSDEIQTVFDRLTEEERYFILVFLQAGGVIQNVERVMGISYPTVKSKLTEIQSKLSGEVNDWHESSEFDKKAFKQEMENLKHRIKHHVRRQVHDNLHRGIGITIHRTMGESDDLEHKFDNDEKRESIKEEKNKSIKSIIDKLESGEIDPDSALDEIKNTK
ncbi:DUF2089 family protein [bacterium]|nr:DUF2089 family protein [bacterium]